jgi:hypothetical protein
VAVLNRLLIEGCFIDKVDEALVKVLELGFLAIEDACIRLKKGSQIETTPGCSLSIKLIADGLLLSIARFLLGFTVVKVRKKRIKKVA